MPLRPAPEGDGEGRKTVSGKHDPKYSGDQSRPFWNRIDRIRRTRGAAVEWGLLYTLGCALQDMEIKTLRALNAAEVRAFGKDVRPKDGSGWDEEAVGIYVVGHDSRGGDGKKGRRGRRSLSPDPRGDDPTGPEPGPRLRSNAKQPKREETALHRRVLRLTAKRVTARQVAARLRIPVRTASGILRGFPLFRWRGRDGIVYCCFR